MKIKNKSWTPLQIERLPEPGYLYSIYVGDCKPEYKSIQVFCIMNGYIKYMRTDFLNGSWTENSLDWSTLLWSCCPTKKQIKKESENTESNYTYIRYNTLDELLEAQSHMKKFIIEKAPNDF